MVPVITSSETGSFPWSVLHDRHPAIIARVRSGTPYPPSVQQALDRLLAELEGPIVPLGDSFWDRHAGQRWYDVPFLWAENLFYRKLLIALEYFEPGPWQGIDPFAPSKDPELAAADLSGLDRLAGLGQQALLEASLWGNRADLGFGLQAGELGDRVTGLVADDSSVLWEILASGGRVCVVADNAGAELLPDLVLIDHLLRTDRASSVSLHLKAYPYYVSDATVADALAGIARLASADESLGERLRQDVVQGRLVLAAHPFSCAPLGYRDLPADLRDEFAAATVTIMKGDLNYRRLVGDELWPPATPFADVTSYFPGPVAALRTLKSEVVTGLTPSAVDELEASGTAWRTSGSHALIQVRR